MKPCSCERGFASLFLLTALPLVLGGLILLLFFAQGLILRQEMNHICRSKLIQAQQGMSPSLNQLLKLNTTARALIVRRRLALARLALAAASQNPAAITKATLKLLKIRRQQKSLRAAQKVLILRAQAKGTQAVLAAQVKFQKSMYRRRSLMRAFLKLGTPLAQLPAPRLAVRKTNPSEIASPYETSPQFERKQSLDMSWRLPLRPQYFEGYFKRKTGWLQMEGQCSATLTEKSGRFVAVLKKARSY